MKDRVEAAWGEVTVECQLLKIILKAIILKELLVVRIVVRHVVDRVGEAFHQTSPEIVAVAEVNRTVHGFETAFLKPFFSRIEQHVGCFLVVDTVEEAATACFLAVFFVFIDF